MRGHRDLHLVDQSGGEVLLRDVGPAGDRYVLVACGLSRLRERGLDPVRDEVERGATLQLERLAGVPGEHEDRVVEGGVLAPPTAPRIVPPRARASSEHVAAHDRGADVLEPALHDGRARVDLAPFLAVHLAKDLEREEPSVELHPADAERVLLALARAGDEPVQRHRDREGNACHLASWMSRFPRQSRPRFEYRLTAKGRALAVPLLALMQWGDRIAPTLHARRPGRRLPCSAP